LLCQEAEKSGQQFTIGFNRRFAPLYIEMKKNLTRRSGPAMINCRVSSPGISGTHWMADPSMGGALVGEGCHFVDTMYWLLESEPICVSAFSLPGAKQDPIGENNVVASFLFADGSIGNLTYGTVGNMAAGGERIEAFAPGITVSSENFKRLDVSAETRISRSFWFPKKGYSAQMQSFLDAVRNGSRPEITVRDGARATLGCLRILDSATTLEPCAIDLRSLIS
jgi:polar amino acid transport system substrate-binding protein